MGGRGLAVTLALTCACSDEAAWESGSRMRARTLVAADGFTTLQGWRDTQLGIDCDRAPHGAGACAVPANALRYADAACMRPLLAVPRAAPYAWRVESGTVVTYALEGDPIEPYTIDPIAGCIATHLDPGDLGFAATRIDGVLAVSTSVVVAADFDANHFTIERREWPDGAYELALNGVAASDDVEIADAATRLRSVRVSRHGIDLEVAIYDSQYGQSCVPTVVADGTTRCVPPGGDLPQLFRDNTCTTPLDVLPTTAPFVVRDAAGFVAAVALPTTTVDHGPGYIAHTCEGKFCVPCEARSAPFVIPQHVSLNELVELESVTD